MKKLIPLLLLSTSLPALASQPLAARMNSVYVQVQGTWQSGDAARLATIRAKADAVAQEAAKGRPDDGCFDAAGMLRSMPANIELQWAAKSRDDAQKHLSFWRELNTKYARYAASCEQAGR